MKTIFISYIVAPFLPPVNRHPDILRLPASVCCAEMPGPTQANAEQGGSTGKGMMVS